MAYSDVSTQTYNERIKLISSSLQAFAIALTIGLIGVGWNDGLTFALVFWGLAAIFLFAAAFEVLRFLED